MAGQSKPMRLPPWGSAIAGSTGAVLANAIVYPLDMYVRDGSQENDIGADKRIRPFPAESKQNSKCK